jgi:hypothetical protein
MVKKAADWEIKGKIQVQMPSLKKTERNVSWNIYIIALVFSIIIFGSGMWAGLQIEKSVTEKMMDTISTVRQSITSLETMLLFEESPEFCDFFNEEMNKFDSETASLGEKIGYMEEHRGEDLALKSEYMTLELRDYLLVKRIDKVCGTKTNIILYFLNSDTCSDCFSQGLELTKARQNTSMRVYSFDIIVNNTAITALQKSFNVSSFPSLVINGKKWTGLMHSEEILNILDQSRQNK